MTNKIAEINATRARTVITTMRADARTIATIGLWLHRNNEAPRSFAELQRVGLELLREMIIAESPELDVHDTSSALEVIRRLGLKDVGSMKKSMKPLMTQLALESAVLEGRDPHAPLADQPTKPYQHSEYSEALRRMEQGPSQDFSALGDFPKGGDANALTNEGSEDNGDTDIGPSG